MTGVVRVFLAPESAPNPPPALVSCWLIIDLGVLKAALGRVRIPAVGVAGHKSIPLAWRVGASSNVRWNAYVRHTGRILSIGTQAARDRHSPNMLSRPAAD